MEDFNKEELKKLYKPYPSSHKGQNGKLLIIGGSHLFHAASLWALKVASRIVDMVFYSSVPENNRLVEKAKEEFKDGIIVPRDKLNHYIEEADCILIGPGLPRKEGEEEGDEDTKELTTGLLETYPEKKWVIDGGSLQVIEPEILPKNSIITPHHLEFKKLFNKEGTEKTAMEMAKKYNIVIVLKGQEDIVCGLDTSFRPPSLKLRRVKGGNAGMTKGGTGDVLAGLVAALYCKNNSFLSACAGSFINKKAGEELYKRVGPYFNASDLTAEIPHIMKNLLDY